MAYLTSLERVSIRPGGGVDIIGAHVFGDGDMGGAAAFRLDHVDDERSINRIEFYYVSRPLDERYAWFTARLDAALARRR